MAYCKLYTNFAAKIKNYSHCLTFKKRIMNKELNEFEPEKRRCKDMLIYEMQRNEKIEHELFKLKRKVKAQNEYIEYLERKIYLY